MGDPRFLRFSTACGICGPILYALVVLFLGILTPGYSQATQLMSELRASGAPYALQMNLGGFLLPGILLIIFASGFRAALRTSAASRAGVILVAASGLSYIGEAIFSCDTGCIPVTPAGSFHLLIGEIAICIAVFASIALAVAMRPDARWNLYWQYSIATGVLVAALLPFFPIFPGYQGMVQRLVVGVILVWVFVIARRAYRIVAGTGAPEPGSPPTPG